MDKWALPQKANINGIEYEINSDYRDILEIISYLNSEENEQTRAMIALALFYEDFESLPLADIKDALDYLMAFIDCGETAEDKRPRPKMVDWDQDYLVISSEVNKIAGREIRMIPYLHWFTFIGYFNAIGEGQLSTLVSVRSKIQKRKKLEKWEQEFYKENKAKVDFKPNYTPEEQYEIDRLEALLGE